MIKSLTVEIVYFLLSFIILFLFVFFYGLAFPLQELAFKLSSTKMSSEYGILYFWLISMFSITLFRQIKLKFRSLILNLILMVMWSKIVGNFSI